MSPEMVAVNVPEGDISIKAAVICPPKLKSID
jgi:hypothetical protein